MGMYGKRRSHSKIGSLPLKIRRQVEIMLIKGETYTNISDWLKSLGYDISFMSVYRYGKPFLAKFEKVKQAANTAAILTERGSRKYV